MPLSAMFFMDIKGFVYTNVVDVYAFRLVFSGILPCILHQNARYLAAKRAPFCTKTHFILHQNALLFAANSSEAAANGSFST